MSNNTEKAKELLQKLNGEMTALCREIAVEQPLDPEAHNIYVAVSKLNVIASQVLDNGNPRTVEGAVAVDNAQAMVSIEGVEIRGDVEFEIFHNDQWHRGHRTNSQFGQVFSGDTLTTILSDGIPGRVTFPLKEYK